MPLFFSKSFNRIVLRFWTSNFLGIFSNVQIKHNLSWFYINLFGVYSIHLKKNHVMSTSITNNLPYCPKMLRYSVSIKNYFTANSTALHVCCLDTKSSLMSKGEVKPKGKRLATSYFSIRQSQKERIRRTCFFVRVPCKQRIWSGWC